MVSLGEAYGSLGDYEKQREYLEEALEVQRGIKREMKKSELNLQKL